MILDVEKFWLIVPKNEESILRDIFKEFPRIHWEKLGDEETPEKGNPYDNEISRIEDILRIINIFYPQKKGFLEAFFAGREEISEEEFEKLRSEVSLESLYKEAKSLEKKLSVIEEKEKILTALYEETKYWEFLDSELNFPRTFKRFNLYSGSFKKDDFSEFVREASDILEESWYKYFEINGEVRIVILIPKDKIFYFESLLTKYNFENKRIPYLKHYPKTALEKISNFLIKLKKELSELFEKAKDLYTRKKNILAWYDYYLSKVGELGYKEYSYRSKYFSVFSGWIPKKDKNEFLNIVKKRLTDFGFESRDPLPDEDPPVLLDNPKFIKPFEFLTKLYGLPPYGFIDPTPFMVPFYMLFFGICLGDVGYGLLLLISTIWIKKVYKPEDETKELLDLLTILSFPSILVGIITWSFFGNQIFLGPDGKFIGIFPIINPSQDLITALGIALLIGVISQFYALILRFISCWRVKDYKGAFYDAGLWILFLGSILIYFGGNALKINIPYLQIFKYLIWLSLIGLVLTQGRDNKGVARFIVGLISIYGILGGYGLTSFVGDILSYSRLFALNLVGSIFGFVITQLANMIKGIPVLGFILLPLVWVFGQVLNFVLSALSAFVHSTRLQFLEMYGRFFVDGGRRFSIYRVEGKYFKLKKQSNGR
uniref:V-type ATP synthase subunit I n=1 Tax=Dictyoglomus thermophilum TaxID=14 RepID=A0A7C3RK32_DICTH